MNYQLLYHTCVTHNMIRCTLQLQMIMNVNVRINLSLVQQKPTLLVCFNMQSVCFFCACSYLKHPRSSTPDKSRRMDHTVPQNSEQHFMVYWVCSDKNKKTKRGDSLK